MAADWKSKFKNGCIPDENDYACLIQCAESNQAKPTAADLGFHPDAMYLLSLNRNSFMSALGLPPPPAEPPPEVVIPPTPRNKLAKLVAPLTVLGGSVNIFNFNYTMSQDFYRAKVDVHFSFSILGVTTPNFRLLINNGLVDTYTVYASSVAYQTYKVILNGVCSGSGDTFNINVTGSSRFQGTANPSQTVATVMIQEVY